MPARKTHDVVATVGKYKDQSGEEKKRFVNIGSLFTDENGEMSAKLDTIPVGPEWSGWVRFYPVKDKSASRPAPSNRPPQSQADDQDSPF